jgi:hypothetical protein
MKLATTVINGVCVDCGDNLQEQKAAVKSLMADLGNGRGTAHVLYSSQRAAVRKRMAIPKDADVQKLYDEAKVKVGKANEVAKKKQAAANKKAIVDMAEYKKARKERSAAIASGKKNKKTNTK